MARTTITQITDDYTKAVVNEDEISTIRLTIEGREYALDLTEESRGALHKALAPFLPATYRTYSQPTRGRQPRYLRVRLTNTELRAINQRVRAWWHENPNGLPEPKQYGRIPDTVQAAYQEHLRELARARMDKSRMANRETMKRAAEAYIDELKSKRKKKNG